MISSVALPKVALSSPPMVSLVCRASCSVASPSSAASGRMATQARAKMAPWLKPRCSLAAETGTRASST